MVRAPRCRGTITRAPLARTEGREGAGGGAQQRQVLGQAGELERQQRGLVPRAAVVLQGGQQAGQGGQVGREAGAGPQAQRVQQGGRGRERAGPGEGGARAVQEADAVAGAHEALGRGRPAPPAAEVLQEAHGPRLQRHLRAPRRHQRHAPAPRALRLGPRPHAPLRRRRRRLRLRLARTRCRRRHGRWRHCRAPEARPGPAPSPGSAPLPQQRGMQAQELVPLALPRGRGRHCELCGAAAQLRCGACGVTYYW